MCEIDWEMIHKFVDTLIWPAIALIAIFLFKEQIISLIKRITNESESLEIAGFIKANFKKVGELRDSVDKGENISSDTTSEIIDTTISIQVGTIKELGEQYLQANHDQRRFLHSQISDFSIGLKVEDIESLIQSENTGHKTSAAIALQQIIDRRNIDPSTDKIISDFVAESLKSNSSFLRYEVLQIILPSKKLREKLNSNLETLLQSEKNTAIKSLIKLYVK